MARRLITTVTMGQHVAKVYRDSEWNEWRVVFYAQGVKLLEADHHTDSKQDALATASHEVERMHLAAQALAQLAQPQ